MCRALMETRRKEHQYRYWFRRHRFTIADKAKFTVQTRTNLLFDIIFIEVVYRDDFRLASLDYRTNAGLNFFMLLWKSMFLSIDNVS